MRPYKATACACVHAASSRTAFITRCLSAEQHLMLAARCGHDLPRHVCKVQRCLKLPRHVRACSSWDCAVCEWGRLCSLILVVLKHRWGRRERDRGAEGGRRRPARARAACIMLPSPWR